LTSAITILAVQLAGVVRAVGVRAPIAGGVADSVGDALGDELAIGIRVGAVDITEAVSVPPVGLAGVFSRFAVRIDIYTIA